jgi:hypothetical protein
MAFDGTHDRAAAVPASARLSQHTSHDHPAQPDRIDFVARRHVLILTIVTPEMPNCIVAVCLNLIGIVGMVTLYFR